MQAFKIQLSISFVLFSFFAFSQSNTLVVFSQDPTPFYIILDGVKQNEKAETRVVVPGIQQTNSSVQIYFQDENIPPVSKRIWWEAEHPNDEVTYRIVSTKKGYKLRLFSSKLNTTTYSSTSSTTPPPTTQDVQTATTTQNVQPATTTTTITETTTVRQDNTSGGNNMNMNANMNSGSDTNGGSISMNINVNDGSNSASGNDNLNMSMNINLSETNTSSSETNNSTINETTTTTVTTTTINETPAAPVSAGGCLNPVQDMGSIMAAIDKENFDDEKIIVAKQATSTKCLTVDQIKKIMGGFSFSESKLAFAKYAYKRCYNPDDYYQLNSVFDFIDEKEELNEFIEAQH